MDFKNKEEFNRLARATETNARTISDMSIEVKRLRSEIQAMKEELACLKGQLLKKPLNHEDSSAFKE